MKPKKIVQQIAMICFLASWIVVGIAAHNPNSLKCEQEWKVALVNDSSLVKEGDVDENGRKTQSSKEDTDMLLPGRAISILQ